MRPTGDPTPKTELAFLHGPEPTYRYSIQRYVQYSTIFNDHQSDHPLLYFFFSIRDFSLRLFWGNFQRGLTVFCSVLTPIYHSNKPIHLKIYDRERKAQTTTITSVWRSQVDRVLYVLYRFGWSQSYSSCELHLRYQSFGLGWICSINSTTLLGPS